jgi:hypothetical protein
MKAAVASLWLSAAISLAACTRGPTVFQLPVHNLPSPGGMASGGRIAFDGECVWLEFDGGGEVNLVWPATFRAIGPPLEIIGSSGRGIIHDGDVVELGIMDGRAAIPGCPARGVFLVGEISAVNGEPWPDGAPKVPPPGRPPGNPR